MGPVRLAPAAWFVLSLTVASVIAGADAALGRELSLVGLYCVAPLLASLRLGPRVTLAVAVYTLVLGAVAFPGDIGGLDEHMVRMAVLVVAGAFSIRLATLRERERRVAAENALLYEEAREAAERLSRQALHDALTGLPNRTLFSDRLERALARSDRRRMGPAVLFLDLDGFKLVNDTLGHSGGDHLLQLAAARLGEAIRTGDTVARLGGDEFAVLCEEIADEGEAVTVAERVIEALGRPFELGSREVRIGASVGISVAEGPHDYPAALIRNADTAMYHAKDTGRGRWEIFREAMGDDTHGQAAIVGALQLAVEEGGFQVAYQPVLDLRTGQVAAAEALPRWEHPTRGVLGPREFLPLAEESGLIHAIGAFVLDSASRQVQAWCSEHPDDPPLRVLVDVSAAQLAVPELPELVQATLTETGIDPAWLCMELTERTLMEDSRAITNSLLALKGLGVGLAVDHFGPGDASLTALKRVPVDYLKIDGSLIQHLGRRAEDAAMVAAIARMAEALGVEPVAEGVDGGDQPAELRALGVHLAQGPHLAPPGPPDAISRLRRERLSA